MLISLLSTYKEHVIIENGFGTNRVLYWLENFGLSPQKCLSLIGLHAFTGNDYVSSFFRKGNNGCWKLLQKYNRFEECFALLGTSPALAEETINLLENVCYL